MPIDSDTWVENVSYFIYTIYEKLYIKENGGSMRINCICCKSPFIYVNGDNDCSTILCSFCFVDSKLKFASKKWESLRFAILTRDKYTCRYCGDSPLKNDDVILQVDHIDPVVNGGNNGQQNLITSCGRCNFGKYTSELSDDVKQMINEYISKKEIK